MFTGIVETKGKVAGRNGRVVDVQTDLPLSVGDSISVSGVCLTVVESTGSGFVADLSEETIERSTLGGLRMGDWVNLERPVAAAGRLGGHVVQGHVDGVGTVVEITEKEGSVEMWFEPPTDLLKYLVVKGSVAVEGVSLTVSSLQEGKFSAALVPYTLRETVLGERKTGDKVNLEVDILAKYVERLVESYSRPGGGT